MDYVFGINGDVEVLKTKGDTHTDLTGFHEIEQIYPDQTITDRFRIVRKIDSKEDDAGNCYDWYEIDQHYRFTDKTAPIAKKLSETTVVLENAICEQDTDTNTQMSTLEDAICEQDAATDTRTSTLEDAVCEQDTASDTRIGAVEDAICELDAAINHH